MDSRNDEQTELLRGIWNEMKALGQHLGSRIDMTNDRLDQTNQRLDQTNQRLDRTREELGKRISDSEIRTATAITTLAGAVKDVRDLLADRLELRDRVASCEQEIALLKKKVG